MRLLWRVLGIGWLIFVDASAAEEPAWLQVVRQGADLRRAGRFRESEAVYLRAREEFRTLGKESLAAATIEGQLGGLYMGTGRFAEAEPLLRHSLTVFEKLRGEKDVTVGVALNNLADCQRVRANYAEADTLFGRAFVIYEKVYGARHMNVALILYNWSLLCYVAKRTSRAEVLLRRAMEIQEALVGPEAPESMRVRATQALLALDAGRPEEAEHLQRRVLEWRERTQGGGGPGLLLSLNNLALTYLYMKRYTEAEPLLRRALETGEGTDSFDISPILHNLGELCSRQERYAEAEPLLRRAMELTERALGPSHPEVAEILLSYADVLSHLRHKGKAKRMRARAAQILSAHRRGNGLDHSVEVRDLAPGRSGRGYGR